MNRTEFIKFIINKKGLDKEVFKKSLELDDFPSARQILNKLNGNYDTDILLKSNNVVEIKSAQSNLIANLVNFLKDPLIKKETKKFIDDLVDIKLTGYSLPETKRSKAIRRQNNSKLNKKENIEERVNNINKRLESIENREFFRKIQRKIEREGIDDEEIIENLEELIDRSELDNEQFGKEAEKLVNKLVKYQENVKDKEQDDEMEGCFDLVMFSVIVLFALPFVSFFIYDNLNKYCLKSTSGSTVCVKQRDINCKKNIDKSGDIYVSCTSTGILKDKLNNRYDWYEGWNKFIYSEKVFVECAKKEKEDKNKYIKLGKRTFSCNAARKYNMVERLLFPR